MKKKLFNSHNEKKKFFIIMNDEKLFIIFKAYFHRGIGMGIRSHFSYSSSNLCSKQEEKKKMRMKQPRLISRPRRIRHAPHGATRAELKDPDFYDSVRVVVKPEFTTVMIIEQTACHLSEPHEWFQK